MNMYILNLENKNKFIKTIEVSGGAIEPVNYSYGSTKSISQLGCTSAPLGVKLEMSRLVK